MAGHSEAEAGHDLAGPASDEPASLKPLEPCADKALNQSAWERWSAVMLVPAASAAAWQRTTRHPMLLFVVTQGCGLINPVLIGLLFVTRISHRSQAMQWSLICAYATTAAA